MEHYKLIRTVKELRQESLAQGYALSYTVISGSMRYLMSPGDTVTIQGASPAEIRCGDIIAWNRPEERGGYPVVHRVIERQEVDGTYRFRTKGDFNPFPDSEWVTSENILGRVTIIHKKALNINVIIDNLSGRTIDHMVRGITFIAKLFSQPFSNIKKTDKLITNWEKKTGHLKCFVWDMGYYCNFKCFYCFTSGGEWDRLGKLQGTPKSPEEVEQAWKKIYDSFGTCLIRITGGEPFEYPRFVETVARIARYHFVHITSNLSQPAGTMTGRFDPGRVAFNATFHPQYMDIKTFIGHVLELRNAGFTCDVCYLAHPSQLREMLEYRKQFLNKKINMTIIEFRGTYQGKEYPRDYSGTERAFMQYVQRWQSDMRDAGPEAFADHDASPENRPSVSRGKPCGAGSCYAMVAVDGNVKPCSQVAGPALGNIFAGNVSLLEKPLSCPVDSHGCDEAE